jgi:hypothetical protein
MTTSTTTDATLTITLDSGSGAVDYSAQVINASFTPASNGAGSLVQVATGDKVTEPGEPQFGSLTGEVFKDAASAGFTRALLAAQAAGTVLDYVYTENAATVDELKYTGECTVPPFAVPFTPGKYGRHPLTLQITTSTLAAAWSA